MIILNNIHLAYDNFKNSMHKLLQERFQIVFFNTVSIIVLTTFAFYAMDYRSIEDHNLRTSLARSIAFIIALFLAKASRFSLVIVLLTLLFYSFLSIIHLSFGSLNLSYIASAFESNISESIGLYKTLPIKNYFTALLLFIISIFYYRTTSTYHTLGKFKTLLAIFLSIFYLAVSWPGLTVRQFVILSKTYFIERAELLATVDKPDTWQINLMDTYRKYDNYVLIIGESVRRDYLSVYGYNHLTTPWLNEANGLFIKGMISMGPNTVSSLSRTLQQTTDDGLTPIPQNNVITLANKAYYNTYWISNQGKLGKHDTSTSTIAIRANQTIFLKKGSYGDSNIDDKELLQSFKYILNTPPIGTRLIVLHMLGSHPPPCDRLHGYPVNFDTLYNESFNCYLASIEKTDNFIKRLIQYLELNGSYSLMYLSDHGVSITPDTIRVNKKYQNSYDIPLFILSSDSKEHIVVSKRISGTHFIDLFANWLGIDVNSSKMYDIENPHNIHEDIRPVVYNFEKMIEYDALTKQETFY